MIVTATRYARLAASAMLLLPTISGCAAASDLPTDGKQTYALDLKRDASPAQFGKAYAQLATWGYFGPETQARRERRPLTQAQRVISRKFGFTKNVNVDDDYCPGALTPEVKGGALILTAYRLPPEQIATCGQGREWASAYVSSQPSFAQTYGYFEIEATIPCDAGRWPAFWLLPVAKTKENGGRLAEIDVFEHFGGTRSVVSGNGKTVVINRIGQPFSTLHYGTVAQEQKIGNGQRMPKIAQGAREAFCRARHSYGVRWTKERFTFYIDRKETFATPNPGIADPHYWVLNLDVSPIAGDPALVETPSRFVVYSVKAWR